MSSNPRKTLQSNILPSRNFPCEINCEACRDVVALDDKNAAARRVVAELEAGRPELLSKANNAHDTITNRLPIELFSRILELSLPVVDTLGIESSRLELLGPLVFSAVSRRWKELVRSIPSLWTVIPICIVVTEVPIVVEGLMEEWIRRSGQRLLSFVIKRQRHKQYQPLPVQFIPRIINQYSHRLECLIVESSYSTVDALNFSNAGAQNISTLALEIDDHDSTYDTTARLKFGQGLRPTTLKLQHITLGQLDVHVDRLTHVELILLPMVDCIHLLAHAPMMIHLSIDGFEGVHDIEIKTLIVHRALRYLRLSSHSFYIRRILHSLTVPSLQNLELSPWTWSEPGNASLLIPTLLDIVAHCFQRSSAMLETLNLQIDHSNDIYTSLKRLMDTVGPSIRHLVIEANYALEWDRSEGLQQLVDSIFHGQKPLPLLQSVTVNGFSKSWLHYLQALLLSVARSMSANGARPLLLVMSFDSTPLNTDRRDGSLGIYRYGALSLPGTEIAEMISLTKQFDITIKMPVTGHQHERERDDVFPDVLDVLTRLSLEE